jgi:hypothetical protein
MVNLFCDLAALAYTTTRFQEHVHSVPCYSARQLYKKACSVQLSCKKLTWRQKKTMQIVRNIGGWLQETGQWPSTNLKMPVYRTLSHVLASQVSGAGLIDTFLLGDN